MIFFHKSQLGRKYRCKESKARCIHCSQWHYTKNAKSKVFEDPKGPVLWSRRTNPHSRAPTRQSSKINRDTFTALRFKSSLIGLKLHWGDCSENHKPVELSSREHSSAETYCSDPSLPGTRQVSPDAPQKQPNESQLDTVLKDFCSWFCLFTFQGYWLVRTINLHFFLTVPEGLT